MATPEDTTKRDAKRHLAGSLIEARTGENYIERMEADGARQLVESDVLPTEVKGGPTLESIGIQPGDAVEDDDLFRHVTLPEGWVRRPSSHSMWTYVVDERGLRQVAVFYKAAYYDRRAFCRVTDPIEEAVTQLVWDGTPIPWSKLTEEEAEDARQRLRDAVDDEYVEEDGRNRARQALARS